MQLVDSFPLVENTEASLLYDFLYWSCELIYEVKK